MAKTKDQKQAMLAAYKQYLQDSNGVIVVNPTGLTPNQVNEFKMKLSELGSQYHVVKNTLFKMALNEAGMPALESFESGAHAVIFSGADIAATAKLLKEFMKANEEKVTVDAAVLEGQVLDKAQAEALAELPSKEQSISMILGLIDQSLSGVANVLEDSVRSVAIIINQAFENK